MIRIRLPLTLVLQPAEAVIRQNDPCMASQSSVGIISIIPRATVRKRHQDLYWCILTADADRINLNAAKRRMVFVSTQNIQASIGQYSMHAGDPAQPVQQSVVMARCEVSFTVALPIADRHWPFLVYMSNSVCSELRHAAHLSIVI